MAIRRVGRPATGLRFHSTAFRIGAEHLATLDRLDLSGGGRSAVIRLLIERADQSQGVPVVSICGGVIAFDGGVPLATGSPG